MKLFYRKKACIFMKDGVKNSIDIGYFRVGKKENEKYGNRMYETSVQSRPFKHKIDCLIADIEYNMSL